MFLARSEKVCMICINDIGKKLSQRGPIDNNSRADWRGRATWVEIT